MIFSTEGTEKMTILDSGDVGIGTPTPSSILTVETAANAFATLETTSTTNYTGVLFNTPGTSLFIGGGGTGTPLAPAGLAFYDFITATSRLYMDVNGLFNIGPSLTT